jgi:protein SCO1/2
MSQSNTIPASRSAPRIQQAAVILSAALLLLVIIGMATAPVPLPVIAPAPAFSLIDQDGNPLSDADLRGRNILYDFIYTSCTTICPAITGQMLQVQRALDERGWLGNEVVLVTITFDPERDTPERLRAYAEAMHASPEGWVWLTGESAEIKQLVGGQFGVYFERVSAGDNSAEQHMNHAGTDHEGYEFIHDTKMFLVDEEGNLRAEYRKYPGLDVVMEDIRRLTREGRAPVPEQWLWQLKRWIQGER